MNVSACICTKNEEKMLPGLLNNIVGKVDEIVIVDGGSTDNTIEIAKHFTTSIYEGEGGGPDTDRHIYIKKAKHDWLLCVDADERFCEQFMLNVKCLCGGADGYWLARRNYYSHDKFFQHIIYPDYQLRLFDRRSLKRVNDKIHSRPVVQGFVPVLSTDYYILHLNPVYSDHAKYGRYALKQAEENPGVPSIFRALYMFFLWYGYTMKHGCWHDGPNGIKMAYSMALYQFWLYRAGYKPNIDEGLAI